MTKTIQTVARNYAFADNRQAVWELSISVSFYLFALLTAILNFGNWGIFTASVFTASMMTLRIYMIQHDCLHRSFFTSKLINDLVGTVLSVVAMTPYQATKYIHGQHHTHVSNLDRRDTFEIHTMTLREWETAPTFIRLTYRAFRSPLTLIVFGPFVFYGIIRRMPLVAFKIRYGVSDLIIHNGLLALVLFGIFSIFGWSGLITWLLVFYVASVFGALIPYIVHNFETIHWGTKPDLDFETAALEGSAVLDWGPIYDWTMLNIGYHDLHHLNAKIPGYHLKAAHQELERLELIDSEKIGFWDGLACLKWKLYDEDNKRMIEFPKRNFKDNLHHQKAGS